MSTLESAAAVLRLFTEERAELSVTEAHRLLSMPKSSVARLLQSMKDAGFLDPVEGTRRYQLGLLILDVSRMQRARTPLADLAEEALAEICKTTGHTGYVSVLDGTDIVVLRVRPGTRALQVVTPLGQRMNAFETAIGRSLLSRLSDDQVRSRYTEPLHPSSSNSPLTLDELLALLAEVRKRGWAESIEEALPGVGSTAVAILSQHNNEMLGLCVSYSASHSSKEERQHLAELLREAAIHVGRKVDDPYWITHSTTKPGKNLRLAQDTNAGER